MKNLLYIVLIITLPLIGYFQYAKWSKFNPPNPYDYVVPDSIDVNYFDQETVKLYLETAFEIGSFARRMWRNEGIDVLYPSDNEEALKAAAHYNQMKALATRLEGKLQFAYQLKQNGYNNQQVKSIIETGTTPEAYEREKLMTEMLNVSFGDVNGIVWRLQQQLNTKGYDTPVDGNFRVDTQVTLRQFQSDNGLFPSGALDKETYMKLFQP